MNTVASVTAAGILSILAAAGVFGTLFAGLISSRIGGIRLLSITLVAFTVSIAWLLITGEVWMFYLFAIVFGFFHGAAIPLWTLSAVGLFGMKSLGMIFGTVMMLGTLGGSIYGFAQPAHDHTVLRIKHRGPLDGLYFVGAWTQPGGGFEPAMMSGEQAGEQILKEWKKDRKGGAHGI